MKTVEKKLLNLYRDMSDDDRHTLLRFAEFLSGQGSELKQKLNLETEKPSIIPPAKNETVVGALKRLSASYPMLDKAKMLDQTSSLMSDHLLRGKSKEEVIREFDDLFEEQYQKLIREKESHD